MSKEIHPSCIDVEITVDSHCNSLRIDACCYRAIQARTATLGSASAAAALAKLEVKCPGYDRVFGCQAEIDGSLFDAEGVQIPESEIHTTAKELLESNIPS